MRTMFAGGLRQLLDAAACGASINRPRRSPTRDLVVRADEEMRNCENMMRVRRIRSLLTEIGSGLATAARVRVLDLDRSRVAPTQNRRPAVVGLAVVHPACSGSTRGRAWSARSGVDRRLQL
jgi:hypothetical protein